MYATYCEPCHGQSGHGDGPVAREFAPPMGDLTSADVQSHDEEWFYTVITNGTAHMPRSGHDLAPFERRQIVDFIRPPGGLRR